MVQTDILTIKASDLAHLSYKVSRQFPKEEVFGLTSQLRRAALSVILNIIEGFARLGTKEYQRFLKMSYGSLKEAKYLIRFAFDEKYMTEKDYSEVISLAEEVGRLLWDKLQWCEKQLAT